MGTNFAFLQFCLLIDPFSSSVDVGGDYHVGGVVDDSMGPVFKAGSVASQWQILASHFLVRDPGWGVMVEFEKLFLCRSEEVPASLPWHQPQGCLQLNLKRC